MNRARSRRFPVAFVLLALCGALACTPSPEGDGGPVSDVEPVFPADFAEQYTETRDCRGSHEHELRFIRVVVDDAALPIYQTFEGLYPPGATVVKLEYEDEGCQRLVGYTAMLRLEEGMYPEGRDWHWQKLDSERRVLEDGAPIRCIDCHEFHCAPPNGHYLTCAEEL